MAVERFASTSHTPNPMAGRTGRSRLVPQLVTAAANRPFPQACGLGDGLDPTMPQFEGFAGGPVTTPSLCEIRCKTSEFSLQNFYDTLICSSVKVTL